MKSIRILSIVAYAILCVSFLSPHHIVAQEKKIELATDTWHPYYGPDLENGGFLTELAKEAFKRTGYDCEVKFVPWKRAFEVAKIGNYDGLLGAYFTEERLEFFVYSEPLSEVKVTFFSKKGRNITYRELKDLSPYMIGIVRGYHHTDEFETADYLTKIETADTENNLRILLAERIDLILESRKVVLYLLQEKFPENITDVEAIEPPLQIHKLHVVISKKSPDYEQKVQDFNRGLQMLKEDGTYDVILKKHGF